MLTFCCTLPPFLKEKGIKATVRCSKVGTINLILRKGTPNQFGTVRRRPSCSRLCFEERPDSISLFHFWNKIQSLYVSQMCQATVSFALLSGIWEDILLTWLQMTAMIICSNAASGVTQCETMNSTKATTTLYLLLPSESKVCLK